LWVNLFIPSEVTWKERGVTLRQETSFPDEPRTKLTFAAAPATGETTVKIRVPAWAAGPVAAKLNGNDLLSAPPGAQWLTIKRAWKQGDTVEVSLPMKLHLYKKVDDPSMVAVMYGPIVLAAQMGRDNFPRSDHFTDQNAPNNYPAPAAPVIVSAADDPASWLKSVEGKPLTFATQGTAKPGDVTFIPFYTLAHERYTIYIKQATPTQWVQMEQDLRAKEAAARELDRRTVDQINPGEQQPDIDHAMKGDRTSAGNWQGLSLRHATDGGWFSYQVKVLPTEANTIRVTYWGGETGQRTFDVLIDGRKIAEQRLANNKPGEFFDVDYPLPENLTRGKEQVELRFAARPGNFAGGVFGIRVLKK
jgi:hypothetical protein